MGGARRTIVMLALTACVGMVAMGCGTPTGSGSSSSNNGGGGGGGGGGGTTPLPDTLGGILVEKIACHEIEDATEEVATERLVDDGGHEGLVGILLADAVIVTVQSACPTAVDKAESAIGRYLFAPSSQTVSSGLDLSDFSTALVSTDSSTVATDLGVHQAVVDRVVKTICVDFDLEALGRSLDPVDEVRHAFPQASVANIGGINGLMDVVLNTCPTADGREMSELNAGVLSYLISNSSPPEDVSPPAVILPVVSGPSRSAAGTDLADVSWLAIDRSGIQAFSFWFSAGGGAFQQIQPVNPVRSGIKYTEHLMGLTAGVPYQFAVSAQDTSGNWSAFQYSRVATMP